MARMVDQLLMLARADAGALKPAETNLDVADFLHETAARWRPVADSRHVRVDVEAPDSGSVRADPDLLRRVMDNLIDNATRHTPEGTAVQLSGAPTSGGWNIDVRDQGPGVPPAARSVLFERFVRADGARARDTAGAGLGLALSRAIAESHGGSLTLVDQNGAGATFRVFLPRSPSPARGGGQAGS
jgi:two-component system sensor histidine kinase BaeS